MLYQLHHQFKDGRKIDGMLTDMRAQSDNIETHKELMAWMEEAKKTQPLPPKGAQWMICNEKSEYFWMGKVWEG